MKVLNLFSGIGGNRKLWRDVEVTAVEKDPEIAKIYSDFFPEDEVIVGDAHQFLLEHYEEYEFIWSSPPCQTHTRMNKNFSMKRYIDLKLYQEIVFLQTWFKGKYCVENVIPYYKPFIAARQFGRHLYWTNFFIPETDGKNPQKEINNIIAQNTRKKRKNYDGAIINMNLNKGVFDIKKYKVTTARKDQILRNCVDPETALMILEYAKVGYYDKPMPIGSLFEKTN